MIEYMVVLWALPRRRRVRRKALPYKKQPVQVVK